MRIRKVRVYQMESGTTVKKLNDFIDKKMKEYEDSGNDVVLDVCITSINSESFSEFYNRVVTHQSYLVTFKLG